MTVLKHYRANQEYCEYLRSFDSKVPKVAGDKEERKFVGIVLEISESLQYFVPLTSPKPKHLKMKNQVDCHKIDEGKLGAINFNNMISVAKDCFELVDIKNETSSTSDVDELKYLSLMIDQANWMSKNKETILNKSVKLYELIVNGDQQNKLRERVAPRCCDFTLLEKQSLEYQVKDFEKDFEDLEKVSKEVFENALNSKFSGFYYTVNKDFIAAFDNSSEETEVNNESFEREEFFNVSELRSWLDAKKDENKRQLLRANELTPFSPL